MPNGTAIASRAEYGSPSIEPEFSVRTFDGVMLDESIGSVFGRLYAPIRVMIVRFGRRRMMRALSLDCLERMGYAPEYVQDEILKPFWRE